MSRAAAGRGCPRAVGSRRPWPCTVEEGDLLARDVAAAGAAAVVRPSTPPRRALPCRARWIREKTFGAARDRARAVQWTRRAHRQPRVGPAARWRGPWACVDARSTRGARADASATVISVPSADVRPICSGGHRRRRSTAESRAMGTAERSAGIDERRRRRSRGLGPVGRSCSRRCAPACRASCRSTSAAARTWRP